MCDWMRTYSSPSNEIALHTRLDERLRRAEGSRSPCSHIKCVHRVSELALVAPTHKRKKR